MRCNKFILAVTATLTLSACATTAVKQPSLATGHPNMGKAVKHNMAAQMIAPTPEQKADTYIPANPARRRLARQTYEANEVPEPEQLSTNGD